MIFFGQNLAQKMPKMITSHDVLEPLRQVLLASRDVTNCWPNLQLEVAEVFHTCHFALLNRGCANSVVGLELAEFKFLSVGTG